MLGLQIGIGIDDGEVFSSGGNNVEFVVLVGFKGNSTIDNVAEFKTVGGNSRAYVVGIGNENGLHKRLNTLPNERSIADLVLGAGPPDISTFFNVFLLGRIANPDTSDGRKV